jgi:glycosyltransferase involved in cell wall biosynthesis
VTSLVEADEIRDVSGAPWPAIPWRLRLAWAGRLAEGKGLEDLVEALAILVRDEPDGHRTELVLIGDGPARAALEAKARALGVDEKIHWLGYIADRAAYMDPLAACDLFVFPSPAEGFPKVILDAMAVGLPVVARISGELGGLAGAGLIADAGAGSVELAGAISRIGGASDAASRQRTAGTAFATAHTRPVEAAAVVHALPVPPRRP